MIIAAKGTKMNVSLKPETMSILFISFTSVNERQEQRENIEK